MFPAIMKNGMAIRENEFTPPNILITIRFRGRSIPIMNATEVSNKARYTGRPVKIKTSKTANTQNTCHILLLLPFLGD